MSTQIHLIEKVEKNNRKLCVGFFLYFFFCYFFIFENLQILRKFEILISSSKLTLDQLTFQYDNIFLIQ